MTLAKDFLHCLTKERMLRLIEYSDRGGEYLPLEEDLLSPWTAAGVTVNEMRAALDDWTPQK